MAEEVAVYSAELNYSNEITADEIIVVFNGTTYTVPKRIRILPNSDTHTYYGTLGLLDNSDATGEYPFCIYVAQGLNTVYVSTDVFAIHNPFTIKIAEESVTTTPCFDKARGYSCGEEMDTLTEESVTTAAQGDYNEGMLSYSQFIDADTLIVTFDGVEYECPRTMSEVNDNGYGASYDESTGTADWSEYPFAITSSDDGGDVFNTLATEIAGTYSIKIETEEEIITTTSCFEKAVRSIASPLIASPLVVTATLSPGEATEQSPSYLDASTEEIMEAMTTRGVVIQDPHGVVYSVLSVDSLALTIGIGFYNSTTQQTDFEAYEYSVANSQLRYPPQSAQ